MATPRRISQKAALRAPEVVRAWMVNEPPSARWYGHAQPGGTTSPDGVEDPCGDDQGEENTGVIPRRRALRFAQRALKGARRALGVMSLVPYIRVSRYGTSDPSVGSVLSIEFLCVAFHAMLCPQGLVPYEAFFLCKITISMGTIWEPESEKIVVFHILYENTFS